MHVQEQARNAGQSRLASKPSKQQHARADGVLVARAGATPDHARTGGCKEAKQAMQDEQEEQPQQAEQASRLATRQPS